MTTDDNPYSDHISQKLNHELLSARTRLQDMASLVLRQTQTAVQALIEADRERASESVRIDRQVNAMEVGIDADCERILALHHPTAIDLRLVISITRIVTDLERVGDEAVKIANRAIDLCDEGNSFHGDIEIRHIGHAVCAMLQDAMRAFSQQNTAIARRVLQADKIVDREYNAALRGLITHMVENPRCISRVLKVMSSLRALERIGDHARNIALTVQFLATGAMAMLPELADT